MNNLDLTGLLICKKICILSLSSLGIHSWTDLSKQAYFVLFSMSRHILNFRSSPLDRLKTNSSCSDYSICSISKWFLATENERAQNERFKMRSKWTVRTVWFSDCSLFGLFGARNVRCSDCSLLGMFGVRTVRCSDCSVFGLFAVRTIRC